MAANHVINLRAALRMGATTCIGSNGQLGMLLALRDVGGTLATELTAAWLGSDGMSFLNQHRAELVAGRCVDLQIHSLRPHQTELRAVITHCQLAPRAPSHIKHTAAQAAQTNQQPESQA